MVFLFVCGVGVCACVWGVCLGLLVVGVDMCDVCVGMCVWSVCGVCVGCVCF